MDANEAASERPEDHRAAFNAALTRARRSVRARLGLQSAAIVIALSLCAFLGAAWALDFVRFAPASLTWLRLGWFVLAIVACLVGLI